MAITFFGSASNPTDAVALDGSVMPVAVTPPASMVAGDLVYIVAASRKSTASLAMSNTGGQTWTAGTLRQSGSLSMRVFRATFNGTWGADPSVTCAADTTPFSIRMVVFRPTAGFNNWVVDDSTITAFSAPISPFDVTALSRTPVSASTVTIFAFCSQDDNTWAMQTGGITMAGGAQVRNAAGSGLSFSIGYKIQTSAAPTGDVVNRQATLGGDAGIYAAHCFAEINTSVTIADAGDELYSNGETGVVVSGVNFGASRTGSADVIISPTDNIADGAAISQLTSAWADTQLTLGALSLSSFTPFAQLYLFVKNSGGTANSSGFPVKRESHMQLTQTLKSLASVAAANLTGVVYRITKGTLDGTLLLSASDGTTDASGVFVSPVYTLTEGGSLAPGDDVCFVAYHPGSGQSTSKGTCVQVTPTYT